MSECTELSLYAKLRKDIPKEILAILRYMLESGEGAPTPSLPDPDEPPFATKLLRVMLRTDSANLSCQRSSLRANQSAANGGCGHSDGAQWRLPHRFSRCGILHCR